MLSLPMDSIKNQTHGDTNNIRSCTPKYLKTTSLFWGRLLRDGIEK